MRKLVIVASVLLLAVIISLVTFDKMRLALVSTSPEQGSTEHPYYEPVVFTFNQELKANQTPTVVVAPNVEGAVKIAGKTLTFTPNTSFELESYTVKIINVVSSKGFKVKESTVNFTTAVPEGPVPKDVEDREQRPDGEPPAKFQDDIVDE